MLGGVFYKGNRLHNPVTGYHDTPWTGDRPTSAAAYLATITTNNDNK